MAKEPKTISEGNSGKVWVDFKTDEVNSVATKFNKPDLKADKCTGGQFAKFVRTKMGIERVGGREGINSKVSKLPKKKQEELADKIKEKRKKINDEIKKLTKDLLEDEGI